MTTPVQHEITSDEVSLYDRQIRVWGVEAQNRLRNSHVLIVNITAAHCEVAKNIVLAGIGSLTLLDDSVLEENEDISSHFMLNSSDVGKNKADAVVPRIAELNPNVQVCAISGNISSSPPSFFDDFTVISVAGCGLSAIKSLERICSSSANGAALFLCGTINFNAFFFSFLHHHTFVMTEPGTNGASDVHKDVSVDYPTFSELFSAHFKDVSSGFGPRLKSSAQQFICIRLMFEFEEKFGRWPDLADMEVFVEFQRSMKSQGLDSLTLPDNVVQETLSCWRQEFAPSTAIIGGILGQEILKTISRKDAPLQNVTIFSGWEGSAINIRIPAQKPSE
uniref:THIF-type NAD/FAD binding fold domain-containing protein n=1 Tax=Spongospora subterranea TaxID=70186 RepID=A0A0H5R7H2_9EUKA|eukprot:CRZ10058.1 hypothetical protein [Spongospora subterranea]